MNSQGYQSARRATERKLASLFLAVVILTSVMSGFTSPGKAQSEAPQNPTPSEPNPVLNDSQALPAASRKLFLPMTPNGWGSSGTGEDWPTLAANPARTSWTSEEVSGDLNVEWYRPIEAYISQNTQIIAAKGLLYISTARGLYALNASNGQTAWQFDTELPLGNSPTIADGVAYVGGFDRKIHALNALTGAPLWSFDEAQAGYSTNPLVVGGLVIAGSRDGYMYAIGANGTSNQGQLVWKFLTGGPILFSAAYKDGIVYFAANDNFAYALQASSGDMVWKSQKLPGDGYQSYWPVIYQNKVIFTAAVGYRQELSPGTASVKDSEGNSYDSFDRMQKDDLFFDKKGGGTVGNVSNQSATWAHGRNILDGSRISEYLEDNPKSDPHLHKPWRRTFIVLNMSDGSEYTYDSDKDGYPEYAPIAWWGTRSGNQYPPIVGPDGIVYSNNIFETGGDKYSIPQGEVMGWMIGTPLLSVIGDQGAIDEPQAISGGGGIIYRNICCDRTGDSSNISINGKRARLWDYSNPLTKLAPGYDVMWWGINPNSSYSRLEGNYGTKNGIYHNSGDQNAIIPYNGKLYVHRSNAIIAFGPGGGPGKLPLLKINPVQDPVNPPTLDQLKGRLEAEVQKMIAAGHLRPGYYNTGQLAQLKGFNNYFDNPGDTLYTLARAYPYLSSQLQEQTKAYLQSEFKTYFDPEMDASIGWASGASREAMPLPPDILQSVNGSGKSTWSGEPWSWSYPPHNLYAMWKYAQIAPEIAGRAYDLAKSKLEISNSSKFDATYMRKWPYEVNAYIAGYIGFLNLQDLAGKSGGDSQIRTTVANELTRLEQLRANNFTKDTYWVQSDTLPSQGDDYIKRALNVAQNFLYLVPEEGDYLNKNALAKVQEAVAEYNFTGPYWFVSRYNATVVEGVMQELYDYNAMFQAKAYILKESREQLTKYLDVPAFERGDLFYLQNLVAAIEAGPH